MSGISGVLIELAAIGNQDSYLNIRPRLTLFRGSYRRITNFAWCPIDVQFQNPVSITDTSATQSSVALPRAGDLVAQMYLFLGLPTRQARSTSGAGFAAIQEAELQIGGYPFDKQSGRYMYFWNQLSHKPGQQEKITVLQGSAADETLWAAAAGAGGNFVGWMGGQPMYVPFSFWFNRFYAQSLPMIALQYHEVKLTVSFNEMDLFDNNALLTTAVTPRNPEAHILVNYIFLDTVERRLFAATPHEYLIDQVHAPDGRNGLNVGGTAGTQTNLNYQPVINHPVKEFVWAFHQHVANRVPEYNDYHGLVNINAPAAPTGAANASNWGNDTFQTFALMLNGNDRLQARNPTYYREVVPREVHSSVASLNGNACGFQVYNYSFAVDPEDWKPSGSCNFSRIDTVTGKFEGVDGQSTLYFYYRNFNVMKIVAGMAGLRYAN